MNARSHALIVNAVEEARHQARLRRAAEAREMVADMAQDDREAKPYAWAFGDEQEPACVANPDGWAVAEAGESEDEAELMARLGMAIAYGE
jgi:hypothetical protein